MWFLKKRDRIIGKLNTAEAEEFSFIRGIDWDLEHLRERRNMIVTLFWEKVKKDRKIPQGKKIEVDRFGQLLLLDEENEQDWENYKDGLRRNRAIDPEKFEKWRNAHNEVAAEQSTSYKEEMDKYLETRTNLMNRIYSKFESETVEEMEIEKEDVDDTGN